jgi:hypothetical protein
MQNLNMNIEKVLKVKTTKKKKKKKLLSFFFPFVSQRNFVMKMELCLKQISVSPGIVSILHILMLGLMFAEGEDLAYGTFCLQYSKDGYHTNAAFLSVMISPSRRSKYRVYSLQPKKLWLCANANEGKKHSHAKNWFKSLIRRRPNDAVQEFPSWNREALELQIQEEEAKMKKKFAAQEAETVQRPIAVWSLFSFRAFRNPKDIIRAAWNRAVKGSPNHLKANEKISPKFVAVPRVDSFGLKLATVTLEQGTRSSAREKRDLRGLQLTPHSSATERWHSPALHNVDGTAGPKAAPGAAGDTWRQSLRRPFTVPATDTAAATHNAFNLSAYDKAQSTVDSAADGKKKHDDTRSTASGVGGTSHQRADGTDVSGAAGRVLWRVVGREGAVVRAGASNVSEVVGTLQQGDVLDVVEQRDDPNEGAWLRLREVWEWHVGPQTWARAAEGWVRVRTPCAAGQAAMVEGLALRGEGEADAGPARDGRALRARSGADDALGAGARGAAGAGPVEGGGRRAGPHGPAGPLRHRGSRPPHVPCALTAPCTSPARSAAQRRPAHARLRPWWGGAG